MNFKGLGYGDHKNGPDFNNKFPALTHKMTSTPLPGVVKEVQNCDPFDITWKVISPIEKRGHKSN